jgi:hypothetical protein
MKGILLKLILAGLIGVVLQSLIVLIQYLDQSKDSGFEYFIQLGFPYKFYYYSTDFTLHAFIKNHFIYDGFVSFLFSFLIILIVSKKRRRRKN